MKKVVKIISGFALLALLSLSFSSFAQPPTAHVNNGNGVKVEIFKGVATLMITDCEGGTLIIPATDQSTSQSKNGVAHMSTAIFLLPEGHCRIPEKAIVDRVNWADGWFTIWHWTPDGKLIFKWIDNRKL